MKARTDRHGLGRGVQIDWQAKLLNFYLIPQLVL